MTAGGFGDEDRGGERGFISCRNEGGHADRGIQLDAWRVHHRLRERGAQAAASQKQRNKHGADAAGAQCEGGCSQLEEAEQQ